MLGLVSGRAVGNAVGCESPAGLHCEVRKSGRSPLEWPKPGAPDTLEASNTLLVMQGSLSAAP